MIDRKILEAVRHVVTHHNCPDGIASAMILRDALPWARVTFAQYGTPEYEALAAEPGMLFCDIMPPRDRAEEFVAAGAVVLDHHKHAQALVSMFGERGVFADETTEPGVSGAMLACREVLRHFEPDDHRYWLVHRFAMLAGVRDTWQTESPSWGDACAQAEALLFYGYEYLANHGKPWLDDDELETGRMLFAKKRASAKSTAERALILGRVAIFNERYASDVAEALREMGAPVDVAAGFAYVGQSDRSMSLVFSLRTIAGGVDVGAIAAANGGGGHTAAAGFTIADWQHRSPVAWLIQALAEAGRLDIIR